MDRSSGGGQEAAKGQAAVAGMDVGPTGGDRAATPRRRPEAPEVLGHFDERTDATPVGAAEAEEGPEVEGHINPILGQQIAQARHRDMVAEADHERRLSEAKGPGGKGIIDHLRNRGGDA